MTAMQQRRATAADWATANPILDPGEFGFETDTLLFKMGDGVTHWNDMVVPYIPTKYITAKGDLIVGSADNTPSRLARGANGQMLVTAADGSLQWADSPDFAPYILATDMAAGYQTISDATAIHALKETSAHAAATYALREDAINAHAVHETSAQAATDFILPATMAANYEHKDYIALKNADQQVVNSTVKVNDTDLLFPVLANTQYMFAVYLTFKGTATGGLNLTFSGPTGYSGIFGMHAPIVTSAGVTGNMRFAVTGPGSSLSIGCAGGTALFAVIKGTIFTVGTAGNVVLQFAQTTAAASTSVTVMANSYIKAIKV